MKLLFLFLIATFGVFSNVPFHGESLENQICVDKIWLENIRGQIACVTPTTAEKLVEREV